MPVFYTEKERKEALKQMRIHPDTERVNSTQAAKILSWRAKEEYHVEHEYNATAVRKHASKLDARPATKPDGSVNTRANTYDVKKLFEIDILPARTNKGPR